MQIMMDVTGLTFDPVNNAPIVILREHNGTRVLPIWIGVVEASAIAFELEKIKLTRPMTHDLLRASIDVLGGRVARVAIVDLKENTYFAIVELEREGRLHVLDARPSDAIALALRGKATIWCEDAVIEQAATQRGRAEARQPAQLEVVEGQGDGPRVILNKDESTWKDLLEKLEPEAFGKYKM